MTEEFDPKDLANQCDTILTEFEKICLGHTVTTQHLLLCGFSIAATGLSSSEEGITRSDFVNRFQMMAYEFANQFADELALPIIDLTKSKI